MVEFFANSLMSGYLQSSAMGRGIVLIQLFGSVVMYTMIIGKWRELRGIQNVSRRVTRDVMGEPCVLNHYLNRRESEHSPIENIYWSTCDRTIKQLSPKTRDAMIKHEQGALPAVLTKHEMGLVKSLAEHALDEESIRVERGMGVIATVVALAPMLGLLGTVWGVLDAFADMGAAGSATIATMAPAISSALVTTVVGLIIAIPGVAMHSVLMSMVRGILSAMEGFEDDLVGRISLEYQEERSV